MPHTLLLLPQTRPNISPTPLPKLLRILPPHPRCLHIRRTLIIRTTQHADDAQEDSFGRLDGRPALRGGFVAVRVVGWGVEDGDADVAGGVDCVGVISREAFCLIGRAEGMRVRTIRVENRGLERHFWGKERVFGGEGEVGAVETSCGVYVSLAMIAEAAGWWGNGLYRHSICNHPLS